MISKLKSLLIYMNSLHYITNIKLVFIRTASNSQWLEMYVHKWCDPKFTNSIGYCIRLCYIYFGYTFMNESKIFCIEWNIVRILYRTKWMSNICGTQLMNDECALVWNNNAICNTVAYYLMIFNIEYKIICDSITDGAARHLY